MERHVGSRKASEAGGRVSTVDRGGHTKGEGLMSTSKSAPKSVSTLSKSDYCKRLLAVIGAIADTSAVSALAARGISQDIPLILVIVLTGVVLAALLDWLMRKGWIDPRNFASLGLFCLISVAFALSSWAWLANTEIKPIHIEILDPQNGMEIRGFRYQVQGQVSEPNARVYVLVHPTAWADIWVQDTPLVDSSGDWRVNGYFGTPGEGIAQDFEILAIATSENFLVTWATGNRLRLGPIDSDRVPQNTNRSNIVTITRVE